MQILWSQRNKENCVYKRHFNKAVYETIGTDPRTVAACIKVLKELGWIKQKNQYTFVLISDFISEDF
jgi:hypothetical protein